MNGNVVSEETLSPQELDQLFLRRRQLFQAAQSPEEIRDLYTRTLTDFPVRYRYSTQDYARQGVPDIIMRRDWLDEHVPPGLVVDIGCSDGYFALELASDSRRVIGIDMLERRVERANMTAQEERRNAQFVLGLAEEIPYDNDHFDTAILSHMLEHVYDPEAVLREAVRVTKPRGTLIAIVPPDIGRDPTHIRCILSRDLRSMLSEYGNVSQEYIVGTKGIGYICTIDKT